MLSEEERSVEVLPLAFRKVSDSVVVCTVCDKEIRTVSRSELPNLFHQHMNSNKHVKAVQSSRHTISLQVQQASAATTAPTSSSAATPTQHQTQPQSQPQPQLIDENQAEIQDLCQNQSQNSAHPLLQSETQSNLHNAPPQNFRRRHRDDCLNYSSMSKARKKAYRRKVALKRYVMFEIEMRECKYNAPEKLSEM